MNRTLFVKMVSVASAMALGLSAMGCAVGSDEPVEPAPAPEEQRDPPQQALGGDIREPQSQLITTLENNANIENVPARQVPRIPMPTPLPE